MSTCLSCSFTPPSLAPSDSGDESRDADVTDVEPTADTGTHPADSGASDLGIPDSGLDGGRPDALPQDTGVRDAGPPDTGAPDTGPPDTGVRDAGFPDAAPPDAGGCPVVGTTPALYFTAQAPHGSDLPVLLYDLDANGLDELVISSRADGRFTVLAPSDLCTASAQTADAPLPVGGPLIAEPESLIVAPNGTGLEAFAYDAVAGALDSVLTLDLGDRIDSAASSPDGTFFVATGFDQGHTGFFGLDAQNQPGWTEYGTAPLARPAYFSFPTSANYPRFVSQDGDRAVLLRPDTSEYALSDGTTVTPDGPPATMAGGGGHVYIAYAAHDLLGAIITIQDVNSNNFNDSGYTTPSVPSGIVGAPIAHDGSGNPRFYYTLDDGSVRGCQIDRGITGLRCDASPTPAINSFSVGAGLASVGLVSAYVDNDAIPEIIVIDAAAGVVHFRGADLSVEVAPPVSLGQAVAGTPAYSVHLPGNASGLVVPHRSGRVSVIAWARPAQAGGPERIWAQDGRDAYRSSFLP
ncbi:MAG: hypothetical protein HYV07_21740 [Deltaproteobacteria bacterium]|nr:hypothetical protein [Deltaproteobacteria bacterium]